VIDFVRAIVHAATGLPGVAPDPAVRWLLAAGFASLCWRALLRGAFTGREYGAAEGVRAVLRIPIANVILIMAGRRALMAYLHSLAGAPLRWDKTVHSQHVAQFAHPHHAAMVPLAAQSPSPRGLIPGSRQQVPA